MSILEQEYYKVDIQYLQKSQLLVVAKSPDEAKTMVSNNIQEGTELFEITAVNVLSDEEKEWVLKNMQGIEDPVENEIQDTRTLN